MPNYKYLIANEKDHKWGLTVTTVGQQLIEPGTDYPSTDHPRGYLYTAKDGRTLNEFQIVYITKGKGWFISRHLEKSEILAGNIMLLFPNEWHNYAPDPETGWEESWIGFSGPIAYNLLKEGFLTPESPLLRIGINDAVWRLFGRACVVAKTQSRAFQQELSGIAMDLLGTIYSVEKQSGYMNLNETNKLENSKIFMLEHIDEKFEMQTVAETIGMGYSNFRKLFKEYTGFSPASYFTELKIQQCKELLTNSSLSCQGIAYKMGFQSPSYFNTVFLNRTGMTPKEYRKLTRG